MPEATSATFSIGVISDTHGLLRPEVTQHFNGVSHIFHAGDIGSIDILKRLETIAPVTAVSGNMDKGAIASFLNDTETLTFRNFKFFMIHDLSHFNGTSPSSKFDVIISGHTHLPQLQNNNGVMYLNPGSAGPERTGKPISLAKITFREGRLWAKHIYL
jgi:putative phosphoesterase